MAHNKVYGICESKCKVEVPSKTEFNALKNSMPTDSNLEALQNQIDSLQSQINILDSEINSVDSNLSVVRSSLNKLEQGVGALDYISNISCTFGGFITTAKADCVFTIPMGRSLKGVYGVSFQSGTITIRQNGKYLLESQSIGDGLQFTCNINEKLNCIDVLMQDTLNGTFVDAVNNSECSIKFTNVTIELSRNIN